MIFIFLSSLIFAQRERFELFLKAYFFQAVILVAPLTWHLLSQRLAWLWVLILVVVLWVVSLLCRSYKFTRRAKICDMWQDRDRQMTKLEVLVPWKVTRPGQYCYLSFPELSLRERIQSHPFVVAWWTESGSDTKLTFLIETQNGLTARLAREASLRSVQIEGPYGQDLPVEKYDNVMLVAKGVGIAGVLPYARFLAVRKLHDEKIKSLENMKFNNEKVHGIEMEKLNNEIAKSVEKYMPLHRDHTRKIDVFWKLDDNDQEQWVSEYIDQLEKWYKVSFALHPGIVLLIIKI
jgi:predicted ferric reductase